MRQFSDSTIDTGEARIFVRYGGLGPPLVLLHGFPQTHLMWREVAPQLADTFSVVMMDLRGYGQSSCPASDEHHSAYSKRSLARDVVAVMGALGHFRFSVAGHDRGGRVAYRRGSSNEQTTADESLLLRAGVCRDFAHLGIAFCRALSIPARFVSCYAYGLEPRDFHAVFEAYLDGRWWLFDGTRQTNLDGLVRIGVGRDAAEIAFASPFGEIEAGPVKITIDHADGSPELPGRTTDAISTEEPAPNAGAK